MAATASGRPLTETRLKERFFRYFQHEVTALQEQMDRLQDTALVGGERVDAVDHCLAGIGRLSKEVKDASSYVPAYDQRTYGEAIKALTEKLNETRSAFAPKARFQFKTAPKNPSAISLNDAAEIASAQRRHIPGYRSNPISSAESSPATTPAYLQTPPNGSGTDSPDYNNSGSSLGCVSGSVSAPSGGLEASSSTLLDPNSAAIRKLSFAQSSSISISGHTALHIILPSSASHATSPGSLTNLRHCVVDMSVPTANGRPFAGLTLKNIKESLIVCGHVNSAAHVTGVEGSVLVVASRQFRMHECRDCVVYLDCSSRPIIEDCKGIQFAPLPKAYVIENPASYQPNQWDQVDDFKWLKAEHSPNWSILPPAEQVPDEVWRDIVPGGPGWSLDDILKATNVIKTP
ncbi:Tubulin-specific chaperone C [Lasallia pustulata]|uniref:Tubulin-specific chaperone C n=1 Tax=Lasallia pustulata TaxID=136370 RepID=A0A1W5DAV4_9LECA|nr:Tubulin-specific chaperone C [Lasallia pustulata]